MKDFPKLAPRTLCTGCGACLNACATGAISMRADAEGFSYPCVQTDACVRCGLCVTACPTLRPVYSNTDAPRCFAMMAEDGERMKSSTGAFVPAVARWVLERRGKVYGAVWNADWSVSLKGADSLESFEPMRGSKYVQASTELTCREALRDLKEGKWVLYTGTPCQIAGLYGFLGKQVFERLITIEVVCHGAPSWKVFRKYLDENFAVDKIANISFRDKAAFGWAVGMHVYFTDGQAFHEHADNNIYMKAFNPVLIMRPACAGCPFSRLPRQADFSAGDFWGVSQHDPALNDGRGTSFVLVNNDRHKGMLDALSKEFKLWKSVPVDAVTRVNKTVIHPFKAHSGRKHFFSSLDLKPFSALVKDSLSHHYDIGIVGLWYGINYGSVLTYYALYNLVRDIGFDPVMLPKPNSLWNDSFNALDTIAQKFIWKYCNVFLPFSSQSTYQTVNNLCSDFIVGSDVVWNYNICGRESGHFFFLDFVESGHKKISFASSFGSGLSGPEKHQKLARFYLNDFTAVSCREAASTEKLREICAGKDVAHVLDPVFVCDEKYYRIPIETSRMNRKGNFCFSYLLNRDMYQEKQLIMGLICKIHQLSNVICGNPHGLEKIRSAYGEDVRDVLSVEDWLACISNASFYFGDSYHGLCFALIFHKPFIIVYSSRMQNSSIERFKSLLSVVGLEERLVSDSASLQNYIDLIEKKIDWNAVDERLARMKAFSLQWLTSVLKGTGQA